MKGIKRKAKNRREINECESNLDRQEINGRKREIKRKERNE